MLSIGKFAARRRLQPGHPHPYNHASSRVVESQLCRCFQQRSISHTWIMTASIDPRVDPRKPRVPAIPPLKLPQLDKKWRAVWKRTDDNPAKKGRAKEKMYIMPMFPYPSGDLHIGHLRVYTISDVLARFKRMQGYDVTHPIGWDAFGLPAENAAIERGIHPAAWTKRNINKMKGQLEAMNGSWDWKREFATSDPSFYKHTQRLFLLLHEYGLAYQKKSLVNYDPVDKTVLANEQVDSNGNSWRSGAKVEKRMLKQWYLNISEFRNELLEDLGVLGENGAWPKRVLIQQKNWIGKSAGAKIKFPLIAHDKVAYSNIEVLTTRPDTMFGVQYIGLAPTHPLVQELAKTDVELQAFLDTLPALPLDSKAGYLLPNVHAINPLASEESTPDATKAHLPLYVAPYVLGDYGGGAVPGAPGHDTRDYAFWKHNRHDDPVRIVLSSSRDEADVVRNQPFVHQGYLTSQNGPYAGQTSAQGAKKIVEFLKSKGLGSAAETWRLRDWLISRQRYWGTPIPIIHCDSCGAVPVPADQLPVELPPVEDHWAKGKPGNPLEHAHDWINTPCPKCGNAAKRDTDTMDTFVDSSWYYMRFPDPGNKNMLFSPESANATLPVDIYVGGVEHAILHLLYARFVSKFIARTPHWPNGFENRGEPFKRVLAQGMVHGKTYSDPTTGRFLKPTEVDLSTPSRPLITVTKMTPSITYEKMSKSKYNGVDPGACMMKYGADATRAHILFQAPVSEVLEWDEEKISGVLRWLRRIHDHVYSNIGRPGWVSDSPACTASEAFGYDIKSHLIQVSEDFRENRLAHLDSSLADPLLRAHPEDMKLWRAVQKTITRVTESYNNGYSLNTVVSDLMSLTNNILDHTAGNSLIVNYHATMMLIRMMAPITPAFSEEYWALLSYCAPTWRTRVHHFAINSRNGQFFKGLPDMYRSNKRKSVFDQPFPVQDGSYDMLSPQTQTVSVQVNGKLKIVLQLAKPDLALEGEKLQRWIVEEILATKLGGEKFVGAMDVTKAKKVIVVKGGKLVNFVM